MSCTLLEYETEQAVPRVLPPGWDVDHGCGNVLFNRSIGISVIISAERHDDGRRWLHVSLARRSRLPTWDDVRLIKDLFVGRGRKAIQILPPENEYVNVHPHCLHLWSCLDDDGLPDFRREGGL